MKRRSVTKLDNQNKVTLKKIDNDVMSEYFHVIVFFQFMANLEPFGSRIPNAWSIKLIF